MLVSFIDREEVHTVQKSAKTVKTSARRLGLSDFNNFLVVGCQECQLLLRKVLMQSLLHGSSPSQWQPKQEKAMRLAASGVKTYI